MHFRKKPDQGFTLIETLIGILLFVLIGTAIYFSFTNVLSALGRAKLRSAAIAALENEIETVRNIPYPDVGVQGGSPSGNVQANKTVTVGNVDFVINTTVRNVDDAYDGVAPADTIPGDYKTVEMTVSCATVCDLAPITMTTTVAPKNIEQASKEGQLFINVFDASGLPISNANVQIDNTSVSPAIHLNDVTDSNGSLNFVSIATSSAGYRISVTKSGYSTDRTYPPGDVNNPNPIKPDATVAEDERTKVSFAIDRTGIFSMKTQDKFCQAVPNVSFSQIGEKLIGFSPDVPKFSNTYQTDATGQKSISNLEWDSYDFSNQTSAYDVEGMSPINPVVLDPGASANMILTMAQSNPNSLLVDVTDDSGSPVPNAPIRLNGNGTDITLYTGRRFADQIDWSGGQYSSKTSYMDTSQSGLLTLGKIGSKYATSSQELVSNTIDLGSAGTSFYRLSWNPVSQPAGTTLKFQIAANNDNSTWNFKGPNGSASGYYTTSDTQIYSGVNGNRYIRYKVIMQTNDSTVAPNLNGVHIEFSSSCVPSGQVFFHGLQTGTYDLSISQSGYNPFDDPEITIGPGWQFYEATLYTP